jgi:hypothetical protein
MPVGHKRNHSSIEENRNSFEEFPPSRYPSYIHDRNDGGDSGRFHRGQQHHYYHHYHHYQQQQQQRHDDNKRRRIECSPIDRRNYYDRHYRYQINGNYEQEHKRRNQNYLVLRRSHSITSDYDDRNGHYNFKLGESLTQRCMLSSFHF